MPVVLIFEMRYRTSMRLLVLIIVLAALAPSKPTFAIANSDLKDSYQPIIERNSFGLKPPPPPPQLIPTNKPPDTKGKSEIFLTGFTSVGYPKIPKRAYIMIKEQNKKEPAYYSLSEGQGRDGVEVLSGGIDEVAKTVKIKWEDQETLLSFATHGITNNSPPLAAVTLPGMQGGRPGVPPPMGTDPNVHHPGMNAQPGLTPSQPGEGYGGGSYSNPAATARQIPSRSVRVAPPAGGIPPIEGGGGINSPGGAPSQQAPVDPAQQYLQLRLQEEAAKRQGIILPPTPPLP
jgi:hypothetical protein